MKNQLLDLARSTIDDVHQGLGTPDCRDIKVRVRRARVVAYATSLSLASPDLRRRLEHRPRSARLMLPLEVANRRDRHVVDCLQGHFDWLDVVHATAARPELHGVVGAMMPLVWWPDPDPRDAEQPVPSGRAS